MNPLFAESDLNILRETRPSVDVEPDIYILDDDNLKFDKYVFQGRILPTKDAVYTRVDADFLLIPKLEAVKTSLDYLNYYKDRIIGLPVTYNSENYQIFYQLTCDQGHAHYFVRYCLLSEYAISMTSLCEFNKGLEELTLLQLCELLYVNSTQILERILV